MKLAFVRFAVVLTAILIPLTGYSHEPDSTTVRLGFTGDIYLGSWAEAHIDTHGVDYPFAETTDLFHQMDLVVGNLENPLTDADEPYIEKTWLLKANPRVAAGLANANIRAVTLANNHILDYGPAGLRDTFAALDSAGIQQFGAGMDKAEALREASFEFHGQTVALLGFSATFPEEFWATDSTAGTAFPYREDVIRRVEETTATHDIVAVLFHWSAEGRDTPKDYQVELAHLCIDHGADVIIGHHPHVVQGIEVYKGAPIFYSLGNFAFASFSETARVGLIADLTFENGSVTEARAIPVDVYNVDVRFQPTPLADAAMDSFFTYLNDISADSLLTGTRIHTDGSVIWGE